MPLSRREVTKDAVQQTVEAAISTAGSLFAIGMDAARQAVQQIGGFATEVFEIAEASRRATEDAQSATHP